MLPPALAELDQLGVQSLDDRVGAVAGPFALLQGFEPEEEDALVGAGAVEAGAVDDRGIGHVVFFAQHLGDLHAELFGFHQGGAVLQLEDAQAVALVFIGDERRWAGR